MPQSERKQMLRSPLSRPNVVTDEIRYAGDRFVEPLNNNGKTCFHRLFNDFLIRGHDDKAIRIKGV
ncbi:MAG: hypothetical protein A2Z25_20860 [Planctomycetes bacterium RBG_16_55_9]|nr:MAG: hypothetical protein A2Z25_20860 [Planctomycetes bacterium RBG_16_55_9]